MCDHPGFRDNVYKQRWNEIMHLALNHKLGDDIPWVKYTSDELKTWSYCFKRLKVLYDKYGLESYNENLEQMEKNCDFKEDNIPQLEDISNFLKNKTGWQLRPVGGLLSQREFLNGLAFKVFHSTQYIWHGSAPLYTPEPDIIHELMGHAPLFADPDFAQFSHQIGLATLGASESDIKKIATIYWFTVEFGICMENNKRKAYGAGILSSVGELEYAFEQNIAKFLPLDFENCGLNYQDIPISKYQPVYFVAKSFKDAC
jgi:phenylalanine-4-hydroxylase